LSAGVWATIDFPGETNTLIASINAIGQIVGTYNDENGTTHGFVGTPER
jgi:probable HAF family extracellular repeat protein